MGVPPVSHPLEFGIFHKPSSSCGIPATTGSILFPFFWIPLQHDESNFPHPNHSKSFHKSPISIHFMQSFTPTQIPHFLRMNWMNYHRSIGEIPGEIPGGFVGWAIRSDRLEDFRPDKDQSQQEFEARPAMFKVAHGEQCQSGRGKWNRAT